MKIVNVSYISFPLRPDPMAWIKESRFFKGIWEAVSEKEEVHFFEFIDFEGLVNEKGVNYHFAKQTKAALRFPFKTNRSIAKLKPDVVIVHGLLFPLQVILLRLALGLKVKIIVQHHGEMAFQRRWKKCFQHVAYYCTDRYFFTSKNIADPWIEAGIIKTKNKVHEIMEVSSVFLPMPKKKAVVHTNVIADNAYIWVGHLNINKDPLLVVKAFSHFVEHGANADLYMIFQSNGLLSDIEKWLLQHPVAAKHIHLIGKVAHEDLLYWYNSVDHVISSSHSEAGGVSVCEAMSCGCIPILSNIPSFQFMTNKACGSLYQAGDVDALVKALENSVHVNKIIEKEKTLQQFEQRLSFNAIAHSILQCLS